ncbi:MAG: ChbG/HpnK family deacetylase [Verrucomicrobiae bacterium]|nr:ChbG/HpnK family deacetylase [Verrucomicrobiae bacterium]
MLIVNADDWGGWHSATDAALKYFSKGIVTSASAMVFMEDSERAAGLAKENGLSTGLHLNFTQAFTGIAVNKQLERALRATSKYLCSSRLASLVYNPFLHASFSRLCAAQIEEYRRLYGTEPTHINGHQHMHLCMNVIISGFLPRGAIVRRNFTFRKGEKSFLNRAYRDILDARLSRHHTLTDQFYSLKSAIEHRRLSAILEASKTNSVELMTHPEWVIESQFLDDPENESALHGVTVGDFSDLRH